MVSAIPEEAIRHVRRALWFWMAGVVVVSVFAFVLGAPGRACALAAALALAPAVCAISLASRWREMWAGAIAIDSFNITSSAGIALTGGTLSPLAATALIAPALALRLFGPARAAESAALAVLGYAAAAAVAAAAPSPAIVVAPGAFTVLTLATIGWLLIGPQGRSAPAPAAAMTRRFAEAAHELRTPLGHILGFAEIMQRRLFGPLPDKYGEYVDLIVDSGRRMNALAAHWLDLGKLDAGRFEIAREEIDLAELVQAAARDATNAARMKDQRIDVVGADGSTPFSADPRALRQILDNLLSNAMKFTPAGGAIVVRLIAGPQAAVIDVEDSGPGIAPADKARLGRAFERGAGAALAEGTGLGLAVSIGLAAAHGGRLDALDAERGGALMRVVLPRV